MIRKEIFWNLLFFHLISCISLPKYITFSLNASLLFPKAPNENLAVFILLGHFCWRKTILSATEFKLSKYKLI